MSRIAPQQQEFAKAYQPYVVTPTVPKGMNPGSRITLVSFVETQGYTLDYSPVGHKDFLHAEVPLLESALYRRPESYRRETDQNIVRFGVTRRDGRLVGVAFPPGEFLKVARSARDLGVHAFNGTSDSRWGDPERTQAHEASLRAGGHAIEIKIDVMKALQATYAEDRQTMHDLMKNLFHPDQKRIKAKKMAGMLAVADDRVHEIVQIAGPFLGMKDRQMVGQHNAIRRKMFGGNYSHSERVYNLSRYVIMAGQHITARTAEVGASLARSASALAGPYQEALDREEARLKALEAEAGGQAA